MGVSDYFSDEEIKTLDKCITYASGRRMIVCNVWRVVEPMTGGPVWYAQSVVGC